MTTDVLDPRLEQEGLSTREFFISHTTSTTDEDETIAGRILIQRLFFRETEWKIIVKAERPFDGWITPIFEELCELLDLPPNWDSYGAPQIEKQCVIDALYLLSNTASTSTPKPWVVPTSHGGVQLEWHRGGIDFEIEINPNKKVCILYEDQSEEYIEKDCNLDIETPLIRRLIENLPDHS